MIFKNLWDLNDKISILSDGDLQGILVADSSGKITTDFSTIEDLPDFKTLLNGFPKLRVVEDQGKLHYNFRNGILVQGKSEDVISFAYQVDMLSKNYELLNTRNILFNELSKDEQMTYMRLFFDLLEEFEKILDCYPELDSVELDASSIYGSMFQYRELLHYCDLVFIFRTTNELPETLPAHCLRDHEKIGELQSTDNFQIDVFARKGNYIWN